jgi:hypothetical protein
VITAMVIALACAAGIWLATLDARTDDTAIEAGLIFACAVALAAVRPRAAVVVALCVGAPIPLAEAMASGRLTAGVAALGFALAGALLGAYLGIVVRRAVQPSA